MDVALTLTGSTLIECIDHEAQGPELLRDTLKFWIKLCAKLSLQRFAGYRSILPCSLLRAIKTCDQRERESLSYTEEGVDA